MAMHEVQKGTLTSSTPKNDICEVDSMAFYYVLKHMRELLPNFC